MRRKKAPQLTLPGMPAPTRAVQDKGEAKDLFTDSFLRRERAAKLMAEEAEGAGAALLAGREQVRESLERVWERAAGWNEKALRTRLIEPVLDALGWKGCHYPDPPVDIKPHAKFADYALFADADGCQEGIRDSKVVPGAKVVAWMEVKRWRQDLGASQADKRLKRVVYPEGQIRDYILLPRSQWPVKWGILTNGQVWRLYHHETVPRAYYEINLEAAVGDEEVWRRFFLLFRREAFADRGFLGRLLEENERARTELSRHLKDAVYDALEQVAQGFLDHPDNRLIPDDATLEEIRWGSFVLLYRLLFSLFGEYHGLLPVTNSDYRRHSLEKMIEEIGEREPERPALGTQRVSARWDALRRLFDTINRGDKAMGVSEYNGTLFEKGALGPRLLDDPAVKIADAWVDRALWFLTRDRAGKRLDFGELGSRDVALRELGSVYEGLLEQQVRCAKEDMVWVRVEKGKKGEKALTEAEAKEHEPSRRGEAIPAGTVYLETSRGERKATGSYFTPRYIVDYIVEHTVGPLADEAAKKVEGERKRVDRALANLRRRAKGKPDSHDDAKKLKQREKEALLDVLDPYLSLRILDPAMGSGHFLVGAGDSLTRKILADGNRMPLGADGGEREEAAVRRLVVERCLYGVDLNPLAVELAKLSLWIWSAQRDRPLCFLDHHLRCGNSLIGARIADLTQPPVIKPRRLKPAPAESEAVVGPLPFGERLERDMRYAVQEVWKIEHAASDNARAVHEKEEILKSKIEPERLRYKRLADLWCAFWFLEPLRRERKPAVPLGPGDFLAVRDSITSGTEKGLPKDLVRRLKRVDEIARDKHFFHWELEFPEVFFDHSGKPLENPGFDAVIGNPPWGAEFDRSEDAFLRTWYRMFGKELESYVLFVEAHMRTARHGGSSAQILPTSLLAMPYFADARRILLTETALREIVFFPRRVFPEGIAEVMILAFSSPFISDARFSALVDGGRDLEAMVAGTQRTFRQDAFLAEDDCRISVLTAEQDRAVMTLVKRDAWRVAEQWEVRSGIMTHGTGLLASSKVGPSYRPLLFGKDFDRYVILGNEFWINYDTAAARKHRWALREERIFTTSPKLIIRQTGDSLVLCYDADQFFSLKNTHVILPFHGAGDLRYPLAVLNSRLLNWHYQKMVPEHGRPFAEVKIDYVRQLPIRRIRFTTPKGERVRLVREGVASCERWVGAAEGRPYGDFLGSRFGKWLEKRLPRKADGSPDFEREQSDVVHDLLAHLAAQMIEMNKEKQAEVKRFLGWLEREIKRPVDELKQKTRIKDYHEGRFERLLDALKANDTRIGSLADKSSFQGHLQREFDESMKVLGPLKGRLEATDRLIDLVVYRLYGLTEGNVEVVEGGR
jgi:hypothetical protein